MLHRQPGQRHPRTGFGPGTDADHPFRFEDFRHPPQMGVAGRQQRTLLGRRQLVRREVAAAVEEGQRTVIGHEVPGKKGLGGAKTFGEQPPQAPPAHFRSGAGETLDRAFGVFKRGFAHLALDAHPVAHRGDLAEGHAGLHHPEGAGVHADEHHPLAPLAKALQIGRIGRPGVVERVIDVGDGGRKPHAVDGVGQRAGGRFERSRNHDRRGEGIRRSPPGAHATAPL